MKSGIFYLAVFTLASITASAQVDTTRRFSRGDTNTRITTTSRTNVPANQRRNTPLTQSRFRPTDPIGNHQPDVLLDVPNVSVDEITLNVHNLVANLSLDARVANLVHLKAGVDIRIDSVSLGIKGVQATALLIVRLDNVRAIIERTLTTLENNPQLVDRLLSTVDNAVNTVGTIANTALQPGGVISQTVNTLGQTLQRTVDATGNIIEKTLDNTGRILSSKSVGRLLDLPVLSQTTNAAGQTVKRVQDTSGAVIELVLDQAGKIVNQTLVTKGGTAIQ
jgi:hypothetical protein